MLRFVIILGLFFCLTVKADYWVNSSGSGTMNGSSLGNCAIQTNISASSLSPGDTLHIVGTVTNSMENISSGVPGNPVTILFEQGAKASSPDWPLAPNCFILMTGVHDVIVNGGINGTNGIIECTANGVLLPNQVSASGICIQKSYNVIVSNIVFQNLYVSIPGFYNGNGVGIGILYNNIDTSPSYSNVIANCYFHTTMFGVYPQYGPGWHDFIISNCVCSDCLQGIYIGDEGATSTLTNILISKCHCYDWVNWVNPANYHPNGIFAFAASGGTLANLTISGCHIGPTGYGPNQSGGIQVGGGGNVYNTLIYNNILDSTDGTAPNDGFIYFWLKPVHLSTNSVYNNTIVGQGAAQAIELFADWQNISYSTAIYYVTNNLMKSTAQAISQYFSQNISLHSDRNLIFGYGSQPYCSSTSGSCGSASVAAWQSLGYDIHLNQGNPQLTSTYMLGTSSAALGTGANLIGIIPQIDFLGNPSTANIGAFGNAWQNFNVVFTTH